jgi:hypothetical protein
VASWGTLPPASPPAEQSATPSGAVALPAHALFAPAPHRSAPALDAIAPLRFAGAEPATGGLTDAGQSGDRRPSTGGPAKHGSGQRTPLPPSGPPGNAGAGGSGAGSSSTASSALFCAIIVGVLFFFGQELRRHQFRLVLFAPAGVAFPQQRPG